MEGTSMDARIMTEQLTNPLEELLADIRAGEGGEGCPRCGYGMLHSEIPKPKYHCGFCNNDYFIDKIK